MSEKSFSELLLSKKSKDSQIWTSPIFLGNIGERLQQEAEALHTFYSILLAGEASLLSDSSRNAVPVLLDSSEKTGTYLRQEKGITMYAYGCRLLKK